jgi:Dehydroquinase class II
MPVRLMILNGPNLNLLGIREPHIYGSTTLAAIRRSCEELATFLGASLLFEQSHQEARDELHHHSIFSSAAKGCHLRSWPLRLHRNDAGGRTIPW